jgi:predicted nucleic acid-binding protein
MKSCERQDMNKKLILNASPIIALGKADILEIISPIADIWIIPKGVYNEVDVKGVIESYMSDISSKSNVKIEEVSQIHSSIAAWDLGKGESQVLTLGLEAPESTVVLDDLQARKCATLFDIKLIGSLGLIILAKRKALIKKAKPFIYRLIDVGLYIDKLMLKKVLKGINEDD